MAEHQHREAENRFEAVMREAQRRGIDPDLLPYLEEADREDELELTPVNSPANSDKLLQELQAYLQNQDFPGVNPELLPVLLDESEAAAEESFDAASTHAVAAGQPGAAASPAEASESRPGELSEAAQLLTEQVYNESLKDQVDYLYQGLCRRRPEHSIAPTKIRVEKVLDALGSPQDTYDTIHVAGTNGKTSTSRMIDAILGAWGLSTGRFTSPHLRSVCERISLYQEPITNADFVQTYRDITPIVQWVEESLVSEGSGRLSFFEYLTVMAFQAFAQAPVDVAVMEVGMGGQWDSTNVIDSKIQVITPIALDHQAYLGDTIAQIAAEKAGIIRPGGLVVLAQQEAAARQVILEQAAAQRAHVYEYGVDFEVFDQKIAVGGQCFSLRTPAGTYTDIYLPLHGKHQAENAALAIMACEIYQGGGALPADKLEQALKEVSSPGRLEMLKASPRIFVDCAHNPQGAASLAAALEDAFDFKKLVGVFSAMADKDIDALLGQMEPVLDSLVVLEMPGERAADLDTLLQIGTEVFGAERVESADSLASAIDIATTLAEAEQDPQDRVGVIVFGSVVLAGHAQEICAE